MKSALTDAWAGEATHSQLGSFRPLTCSFNIVDHMLMLHPGKIAKLSELPQNAAINYVALLDSSA